MDLTNIETIKNLAKSINIHPSRRSGQNFLISKEVLNQMVRTADLHKTDKVMEIGPGFGTLTIELLSTGAEVVSFEIDKKLAEFLARYKKQYSNFNLFQADIIKSWEIIDQEFKDMEYKLVSNLPYNITSLVLRNFMENKPRPSEMTLMVQKEVAQRVIAQPGEMSILSVAVQFFGCPEKVIDISAENFWPQPEVDSSILKITDIGRDINSYEKKLLPLKPKDFFRTVKIGFAAKRKQLHNNLANGFDISSEKTSLILENIDIKPTVRAQDLTIKEWITITHHFIQN